LAYQMASVDTGVERLLLEVKPTSKTPPGETSVVVEMVEPSVRVSLCSGADWQVRSKTKHVVQWRYRRRCMLHRCISCK
jgi:hypothetical protein